MISNAPKRFFPDLLPCLVTILHASTTTIPSDSEAILTMAGPSLEVFKFGLYLFFPLAIMVHYGDPEWYHEHVLPHPPRNSTDVKAALEDMRQKRIARREERGLPVSSSSFSSSSPSAATGAHVRASRGSSEPAAVAPAPAGYGRRDVQGTVPEWAARASRRLV
ncbi:hypothetical protein OC835_005382 [Tilletia horrida]|nr:hypothetical protein OC835_005382 [Tilletia horrida]